MPGTPLTRWFVGFLALLLVAGCDDSTAPTLVDIDGAWALTVDPNCEGVVFIAQDDNTFEATGWIGGDDCPYLVAGEGSGTINGNTISFGVAFGEDMQTGLTVGNIQFSGTVSASGDEITGTWSAGFASGSWTATRTQVFALEGSVDAHRESVAYDG